MYGQIIKDIRVLRRDNMYKSDEELLKKNYSYLNRTFNRSICEYKEKGLPKIEWGFYSRILSYSEHLSLLSIVINKDLNEGKKYAYISALSYDIEMKKYGWKNVNRNKFFLVRVFHELETIYLSFLTNNKKLIESVISEAAKSDEETIKCNINELYYNIYQTIRCIYNEENNYSNEYINKLESFRDRKDSKNYMYYIDALEAIIEKNEEKLNKALINMNKVHKKLDEYKGTINEILCIPALGIGKLATFKGMKVKCDSIILFDEFMKDTNEINENIEYLNYDL